MKISGECWQCGCKKMDYGDSRYCIFDDTSGAVIIKDEPDKCVFVEKDSEDFKNIYEEFQKNNPD